MSNVPLKYDCLFFVEDKQIQKFMNAFDMADRGLKCFGKFINMSFNSEKMLSGKGIKKFISAINTNDDVHLIVLNDKVIYNRDKYLMLSDGNRFLIVNDFLKQFGEVSNETND